MPARFGWNGAPDRSRNRAGIPVTHGSAVSRPWPALSSFVGVTQPAQLDESVGGKGGLSAGSSVGTDHGEVVDQEHLCVRGPVLDGLDHADDACRGSTDVSSGWRRYFGAEHQGSKRPGDNVPGQAFCAGEWNIVGSS